MCSITSKPDLNGAYVMDSNDSFPKGELEVSS